MNQATKDRISATRTGVPVKASTVRRMSDVEAAWVGALIEGEGSIGPGGRGRRTVRMGNSEVETTATLLRLVGDGHVVMQDNPALHPTGYPIRANKVLWVWSLTSIAGLRDLLPQIIPYLTGKRERAESLLEMI